MRNAQKFALTLTFPGTAKDVLATKMFRFPMQTMHQRMQEILGGDKSRDTLRYVIYSAHDVQIANILEWIQPYNFDF